MQENKVHMSDCALKALELRTLQLFGGFSQSLAGLSLTFQIAGFKHLLVVGVMYSWEVLLVLFPSLFPMKVAGAPAPSSWGKSPTPGP